MPIEQVKVPRAGESISEATLNRWLKPDGSYVKEDEPIAELGTDKATQELPAPTSGVLKHKAKEGDTVAVDSVIAEIDTEAKAPANGKKSAEAKPAAQEKLPAETKPPAEAKLPAETKPQ